MQAMLTSRFRVSKRGEIAFDMGQCCDVVIWWTDRQKTYAPTHPKLPVIQFLMLKNISTLLLQLKSQLVPLQIRKKSYIHFQTSLKSLFDFCYFVVVVIHNVPQSAMNLLLKLVEIFIKNTIKTLEIVMDVNVTSLTAGRTLEGKPSEYLRKYKIQCSCGSTLYWLLCQ